MAERRPTCGTCIHFVQESKEGAGHCRCGPPTVFKMLVPAPPRPGQLVPPGMPPGAPLLEQQLSSHWPPVTAGHWCGMHPDFMTWFSRHHQELQQDMALASADTEGEA